MELVRGLGPLSQMFATNPASESKSLINLYRFFPAHAPIAGDGTWTWDNAKVQAMRTIELMPDVFTVASSINTLTELTYACLPTPMRVALAAIGTLNVFLIPVMLQKIYELAVRFVAKVTSGIGLDQALKITYWASLAVAAGALVALGLKEACSLLERAPPVSQEFLDAILPWIGYAFRLAAILQLMDIVAGARFGNRIDDAIHISERRPSWMPPKTNPILAVINPLTLPRILFHGVKDSYDQAVASTQVIKDHRRYLRRASDLPQGLKATVTRLDASLHSLNPIRRMMAVSETNKLAVQLRDRSISHVRYQVLGLGANVIAVLTMFLTNTVAIAIFSLGSASYYIAQTISGWYLPPAPTLDEKKSKLSLTKEDTKFLSAVGSLGERMFNRVF